ncbi:uncharacterized protein LOC130851059 isoform X2 [Hippopotamus amphibius kiboko]|uniref:uncharacterized protein LOC130851059 isoform X2 n=1 Tax=Hippopotamus amphibius kiboko TaxID=575201 RepID=UPI0025919678|nr:uncharacterized protein LOC130851059 isoform X2 [Hippopotamus amphibius kiboko]
MAKETGEARPQVFPASSRPQSDISPWHVRQAATRPQPVSIHHEFQLSVRADTREPGDEDPLQDDGPPADGPAAPVERSPSGPVPPPEPGPAYGSALPQPQHVLERRHRPAQFSQKEPGQLRPLKMAASCSDVWLLHNARPCAWTPASSPGHQPPGDPHLREQRSRARTSHKPLLVPSRLRLICPWRPGRGVCASSQTAAQRLRAAWCRAAPGIGTHLGSHVCGVEGGLQSPARHSTEGSVF